jgi:hypothetical protein
MIAALTLIAMLVIAALSGRDLFIRGWQGAGIEFSAPQRRASGLNPEADDRGDRRPVERGS